MCAARRAAHGLVHRRHGVDSEWRRHVCLYLDATRYEQPRSHALDTGRVGGFPQLRRSRMRPMKTKVVTKAIAINAGTRGRAPVMRRGTPHLAQGDLLAAMICVPWHCHTFDR